MTITGFMKDGLTDPCHQCFYLCITLSGSYFLSSSQKKITVWSHLSPKVEVREKVIITGGKPSYNCLRILSFGSIWPISFEHSYLQEQLPLYSFLLSL